MNLKFLMIAVLVAECFSAHSATVRLYFVDPLTNEKDTNAFYVTPIGTNVLSNGGVVGRGVTTRYVPASNGYKTNTLAVGHYSITNRSLGSGVVIRVPDSSSLYDYTNLLISGYNIFVTVTNGEGGGTSGALTNDETRAVTFRDQLTLGTAGGFQGDLILHDGVSGSANIDYSAGEVTISSGVRATGGFLGDGSELTGLSGSAITTGNLPAARLGLLGITSTNTTTGFTNLSFRTNSVVLGNSLRAKSAIHVKDGAVWMPSAGSWNDNGGGNYYNWNQYGGHIIWKGATNSNDNEPHVDDYVGAGWGVLAGFYYWGGSSAVPNGKPTILLTAPHLRIEEGYGTDGKWWNGSAMTGANSAAGYGGTVAIGNEAVYGTVIINRNSIYEHGTNYDGALGRSKAVAFQAKGEAAGVSTTTYLAYPGIQGTAVGAGPSQTAGGSTYYAGNLNFYSLVPIANTTNYSTTWADAPGLLGGVLGTNFWDFKFPLHGNALGLSNLVNSSSTFGRSIKANEFPYTFMTVQSNLPLRVLTVGDSVTAKGETTPALRAAFSSYMASGGFGSTYGNDHQIAQDSVLFAQSGGLSTTSGDSHTTQPHFHLSNGQQYISSGAEVLANKLTLYYYAGGAAGTMLVETQALGGSYGTLATINSALGTAHIATNFTLNTREYYRFRITSTGNNYLLDVGLTDTTTQRSQTWATKSTPGDTVTNIIYTPAFWNFFTNYNPHLIIIEAKDTADSILPAMDWFRNNATNSDIVYVSPSPNSDDAGLPAQCDTMFRYARTNTGISVFDKHALFYPTNHWIPITYEDSAHLNYKGVIRASQAFADWFNVDDSKFGVGGKTNVQYFTALDARLVSAGSMQTTLPVNPNEVYYGGLNLLSPGYIMISGAPRGIGLILPPELIRGKKNIAISQRWLTTNAQLIAHSSVLHRLSFDAVGRREKQGTTGGNVLYAGTGTNLMNYRVLNTFTQPAREGDYIYCELGHGGTLTNSIWWMGAKVEAY